MVIDVLILILMEYSLTKEFQASLLAAKVLILILMEYSLTAVQKALKKINRRLNPYSNGILTDPNYKALCSI